MNTIEIFGNPIPLHRPRACKRGPHIRMYNDQEKIMEQYRWQIKFQFNSQPYTVPVHLIFHFFFPILKHTSKVRTSQSLAGLLVPMKRPDLDNLIKFQMDCMNGIVYEDDCQVTKLTAEKLFGLEPKTIIQIIPRFHSKQVADEDNL